MARLQGKQALVIGGTQGMGLATAEALKAEGAQVLVTGTNAANIEKARQTLGKDNAVRSDIANGDDRAVLSATLAERFGQIDALFVFAAIAELAPFHEVSEESFDRQFAINVKGSFFALQRLAPLVRDGGAIITVTVTPATATPSMSVYMATKAAVRAFSQVLAAELVGRNVRVNCIAPGFIDTPTLGVAGLGPEERRAFRQVGDQVTPMHRHGTAEEIAAAAIFLAFDATFSTGIELAVDGGLSTVDAPE